eukprot:CAMPEP_0194352816 /NCGR_PEP_ID=MMETSP0174-20130528/1257_1 /TAXON_ID=216777 /ORGANISM="Proboscia alata, Strain PI-D3" /LENGTH=122 /DNA_ID=CAMNT_0039121121 /DNA_START=201 /DNA_END=569 /DNA_ORIENTATION=-
MPRPRKTKKGIADYEFYAEDFGTTERTGQGGGMIANDEYIDDKNGHSNDKSTPQPKSKNKGEKTKQAAADDSRVIKGKLLAKGLEFGHGGSVMMAGGMSVDLQLGTKTDPVDDKESFTSRAS